MASPTAVAAPPSTSTSFTLRRAARGGIWVVAGRMAGLGLAFLVNAMLAHMLEPRDFGTFVLILSTLNFCAIVARFGLDRSIIRFVAESMGIGDVARAKRALRLSWRTALLTTAITGIATIVGLSLFGEQIEKFSGLRHLIPVIAIGLILLSFLHLAAESLRGFHEVRFATLFDGRPNGPLLNLVFLSLFAGVAMVDGLTLPFVLNAFVAAAVFVLAAAIYCLWKTARHQFASSTGTPLASNAAPLQYSHVLALCAPLWGAQLLAFLLGNADVWIAGASVSRTELALFVAARNLTSIIAVPVYMANQSVISFIPELYSQGRKDELQRLMQSAAVAATAPSLVALALIVLLPGTILALVFGDFYRDAALALVILSFGQFVVTWTGGCQTCLSMTGHHNVQLVVALFTSIVLVVAGTFATRTWGIVGLAVVSASVTAASNLIQYLMVKKYVGVWTHAGMSGISRWIP